MRRLAVPGLVALLAIALVSLLIFGVLQTTDETSINQAVARGENPAASTLRLARLDGDGTASLADYRGRVVLVNFFASWCPPCEREAPVLNRAQRMLEAAGGTVIGVAVDDTTADTREFMEKHGARFPAWRDVDRRLSKAFELIGLPESFVVDENGDIVALERNQIDQRWVDENVGPLLADAG